MVGLELRDELELRKELDELRELPFMSCLRRSSAQIMFNLALSQALARRFRSADYVQTLNAPRSCIAVDWQSCHQLSQLTASGTSLRRKVDGMVIPSAAPTRRSMDAVVSQLVYC